MVSSIMKSRILVAPTKAVQVLEVQAGAWFIAQYYFKGQFQNKLPYFIEGKIRLP